MDIEKISHKQKEQIAYHYFIGGVFCLPFLWWINFFWFFRYAYLAPKFPEQHKLRLWVTLSGGGGLAWLLALVIWIALYQTKRLEWGEFGESISFMLPLGRP